MGSQRVWHDWATELNWTELRHTYDIKKYINGNLESGLVKCIVFITQSCLTLWDPIDYPPPRSSVHGILQARILEWVAVLQGVFWTQGSNLGLLHCRQILYCLSHQGSPRIPGHVKSWLQLMFKWCHRDKCKVIWEWRGIAGIVWVLHTSRGTWDYFFTHTFP